MCRGCKCVLQFCPKVDFPLLVVAGFGYQSSSFRHIALSSQSFTEHAAVQTIDGAEAPSVASPLAQDATRLTQCLFAAVVVDQDRCCVVASLSVFVGIQIVAIVLVYKVDVAFLSLFYVSSSVFAVIVEVAEQV